jgi:CheY-like chemotaxis protein
MDILAKYQNELLAAVAIIILLFIYFLIKKGKTQKKELPSFEETPKEKEENKQEENKYKEKQEADQQIDEDQKQEVLLDGKEEGDFGIEEESVESSTTESTGKFTKREVPPHGKINKDDFKEFSGQRILLAEDNIINQKVITGLLAQSGIEVVIANDGVEALEILEKDDNFILILMDAHMPRMDGFEATKAIRKNPQYDHIVVIALSGDTAADDVRKMKEAGMSEHLEKPLKMDPLYDVLYAYGHNQKERSAPQELTHLNIEEGLEISGYDEEFYNEILHEFLNSYENSASQLVSHIKKGALENADQLLLDIIGVSANIGAQELKSTASKLKSALKENNKEEASKLFITFQKNLSALIQEIKSYLVK